MLLVLLVDVDLVLLGLRVVVGVAPVVVQVGWGYLAPLLPVLVAVPVVELGHGRFVLLLSSFVVSSFVLVLKAVLVHALVGVSRVLLRPLVKLVF